RPPGPQPGALPTELHSPCLSHAHLPEKHAGFKSFLIDHLKYKTRAMIFNQPPVKLLIDPAAPF
ncbi:MAG: hypothetical protein ACLFNW_12340, partial [Desulfobacterales bacterium]